MPCPLCACTAGPWWLLRTEYEIDQFATGHALAAEQFLDRGESVCPLQPQEGPQRGVRELEAFQR